MPKFNWPTNGALIDGVPVADALLTITVRGKNARGRLNGTNVTVNTSIEGIVPINSTTSSMEFNPMIQSIEMVCGARPGSASSITADVTFTAKDAAGAVIGAPVTKTRTTRDTANKPFVQAIVLAAPAGQTIASIEVSVAKSGTNPAPRTHFLGPMSFGQPAGGVLAMAAGAGGGTVTKRTKKKGKPS